MFRSGVNRYVMDISPEGVPANPDLYFGGFTLLVLMSPAQVIATAVNRSGPAGREGLRDGDQIVSINGADATEQTAPALEAMLARTSADQISLTIKRASGTRTIRFALEKVSDLLVRADRRVIDGRIVPSGIADENSHSFEPMR